LIEQLQKLIEADLVEWMAFVAGQLLLLGGRFDIRGMLRQGIVGAQLHPLIKNAYHNQQ
jgi:hypothetical protein